MESDSSSSDETNKADKKVRNELEKYPADYLLLQGGADDITKLDTGTKPTPPLSYYKEEVKRAARNMFVIAESALSQHKQLKKF